MKFPKSDSKYVWTKHVCDKMRYYNLSEQRVRRVLRSPKRIEEGIALNTVAVMDFTGSSKKPQEIWVMYQLLKHKSQYTDYNPFDKAQGWLEHESKVKQSTRLRSSYGGQAKRKNLNSKPLHQYIGVSGKFLIPDSRKRVISAWRYPGRSPIGKKIEVPEEVMEDLKEFIHAP